jgi:hypothetical protein
MWVIPCAAKVADVAWLVAIAISCSFKGFNLRDALIEPFASQRRFLASAAFCFSLSENDTRFAPCTNKSLVHCFLRGKLLACYQQSVIVIE